MGKLYRTRLHGQFVGSIQCVKTVHGDPLEEYFVSSSEVRTPKFLPTLGPIFFSVRLVPPFVSDFPGFGGWKQ